MRKSEWREFFAARSKEMPNGCIEWSNACFANGYGQAWDPITQKSWKAHRLAYDRLVRRIPEGLIVCHSCDNKPCINPKHLFVGTVLDNVRDKISKGRGHGWHQPAEFVRSRSGDGHWSRFHPERLARGDKNGARTHPEKLLRGESNKTAKLKEADIRAIRARLSAGDSDSAIAREYRVNHTTINRVKLGLTWSWLT